MKLKSIFKILGLTLFFAALMLFMLSQNKQLDPAQILFPVAFGTILALSAACLITGEITGKLEELENRCKRLEEELSRQNENNKNGTK